MLFFACRLICIKAPFADRERANCYNPPCCPTKPPCTANPTTPRNIICNTLNRLEGGDPALPRTQSGISAFIIRESQLYLSFPAHKTRRKLRFAQSKFRCLPPLPLLETKIAPPRFASTFFCFHFFCFHFFGSTFLLPLFLLTFFLLPLFNWVSDRVCSLRFDVHLNGGEERDAREFWS